MDKPKAKAYWDVRLATGEDINFIYSTWLNSYRYFGLAVKSIKNSVFFPDYNRVIDAILKDPTTKTLVACLPEKPNVIFGYLVYSYDTLHYVFVKESFRTIGIGRDLFTHAFGSSELLEDQMPIWVTHQTHDAGAILEKYAARLIYNPIKLFKQNEPTEELGENSWQNPKHP